MLKMTKLSKWKWTGYVVWGGNRRIDYKSYTMETKPKKSNRTTGRPKKRWADKMGKYREDWWRVPRGKTRKADGESYILQWIENRRWRRRRAHVVNINFWERSFNLVLNANFGENVEIWKLNVSWYRVDIYGRRDDLN